MTFGEQVKAARDRLNLTQAELAAELVVEKQSISNWECGRTLPWPKEQIRLLSRLLELGTTPAVRERVCDRI